MFKKTLLMLALLLAVTAASAAAAPSYAKWGAIAVKETMKKYGAEIVDYKHIGRRTVSADTAEEQFKLWIRAQGGREFGVYVYVRFDPNSETLRSVRFRESDR
ncbi:DUF3889 domain-containing protein [Paenibacillus thailandensis]|uniref:DUF3889 domain-containing protein n=1 Tax=Paenibacillus thailandensis TaxID=393250 RepID=UPI003642FB59